jgi:hypothetical protein
MGRNEKKFSTEGTENTEKKVKEGTEVGAWF